jgi:DNA (cytosine-5)-methyltransferase 1
MGGGLRYLSVCSGIEAATVAWHPLGWEAAAYSEIEAFPRAVLTHHYPDTPLHGDFTTIGADEYGAIDLLVGGTPCQSFSVAGLRGGMDDERGQLALQFLKLLDRTRARWVVWENVPGVLSSNGGRDFGSFLGGLVELGYGFAYRVLDAQHFGVPQRRRRVFVVGHLGDWRRAAAVLFERYSLSGHPAPRREKGQSAPTIPSRSSAGGGLGTDFDCDGGLIANTGEVAACLVGHPGRTDWETETFVAHAIQSVNTPREKKQNGIGVNDGGQMYSLTARDQHAICFTAKDHGGDALNDCSPTLRAGGHSGSHANAGVMPAVAFQQSQSGFREHDTHATLDANMGSRRHNGVMLGSAVRRLTPRECERLQGFPEAQKSYTILLCRDLSDQQKRNALAALQCRKLQSNAWSADAGGWTLSAEAAAHHSSISLANPAPPVVVDVLIDLERQEARLHSRGRSHSFAANADGNGSFPLPAGVETFAQLAALLTHAWALAITGGRVASPANTTASTHRLNGNGCAISFGREIDERAADAATAIETATRFFTSTTLPSGVDTESLASTLTTLCCCVAHAIAGFIPEQTEKASCFAVRLTTSQGYTLIPYRGKPAADGPRYKALGNSMAVPVMRWIGERISAVDAILASMNAEAA